MIGNIRRLLRAYHLKQRDLAEVLGVSEQAVCDKFHGRTNFTLKDMRKIADAFDVSLDYLTGRSDSAKPLGGVTMRMLICLNAEAEEYRMFRVSFPDYFAAHCSLEFDASPADLRQWREEINRFLNAREQNR